VSALRSPKGLALMAAKIAVSVALLVYVFQRVDWKDIQPRLGHAEPVWVAAAAALLLLSHLLASVVWGRLLRAVGIELPFWKVAAYYHVGLFFNNLLPANVGGDLARTFDAARAGSSRATALSTVLLDRLIGTVALGGVAVVTTIPAIDHFHLAAAYTGVLAFFVIAVVLLRAVLEPRVLAGLERLIARLGLSRLSPALEDLAARLHAFRGQRALLMGLLALALLVQVMRIGVHVLFARAIGLQVETAYFFLFVPLLAVIVSLPISLNGIGVRESAGVGLFGLVGVGQADAIALQFGTFLVAFGISLIGLVVFLVRIPSRRTRSPHGRSHE
jgi:uncharacterized protein (TIRG00374 family)